LNKFYSNKNAYIIPYEITLTEEDKSLKSFHIETLDLKQLC